MALEFFSRFRSTVSIGVLSAAFGAMPGFSQSATYTVDGSTTLTTIATQIQGKTSGVLRVRFKSYQNVGQFSITSLSADSLIFERAEESAEAVEFTGKLFHFENTSTPVVFRNLAFKIKISSGSLIEGYVLGSPNKNLTLDSCLIYGDSSNGLVMSWLGMAGSKIEYRRNILSSTNGTDATINISADTLKIANSYFNVGGILSGAIPRFLEIKNLTSNRLQYSFNGSRTATYSFRNNFYAHPPGKNKLPGTTNKFVMDVQLFASGSAFGNSRFSSWYGFDIPANDVHSDPSNITVVPFGDTTSLWDFRMVGDSTNGYQNPVQTKFPAYNVFPGDTVLPIRLSSRDSVSITFATAQIPRVISGSYGTVSYPAITDSTRTLWLRDTTLQVVGPVSIKTVAFPKAQSQGTPLLFYQSGSNFVPGTAGPEAGVVFGNPLTSARIFIPSFSGQNTAKGNSISVKGFSADTALTFSTITRAGRTNFQASPLVSSTKRWRVIQKNGKPFGFKDSTNAEGNGSVQFGFGKTGTDTPITGDSLTWWLGGSSFVSVADSAGKYWGKTSFAPSIQAQLIERLAAGKGVDTVPLPQGRVITSSLAGHQLKVDSSYQPDQIQFPDMGAFSKGISFLWPGRATGDSFTLTLLKSNGRQQAYMKNGATATLLSPVQEDSLSVTLSFGIGDSGKVIFLARKWRIAAGVKADLALGKDSVAGLLSKTPGDLSLDTNVNLTGLALDTFRVWAKRRLLPDNLDIQEPFTLWLDGPPPIRPERLRAFVRNSAAWDTVSVTREANRYRLSVASTISAVVIAEKLEPADTLPVYPVGKPVVLVQGQTLKLNPTLTLEEKSRTQSYQVEVAFLDATGVWSHVSFKNITPDSVLALPLQAGAIAVVKVGYEGKSGKVTWDLSFTQAPMDAKPFLNAVNQKAKPYRALVKDLIGYPTDMPASQLLAPLDGKEDRFELKTWKGRWESLPGNAIISKGKGYLLATTKPLTPQLDSSKGFVLKPDTLSLDTGWQYVSSPLPIPVADASIGLDTAAVSYFHALQWQGSGKDATYNWAIVDTLKPFQGYAVHASRKTNLIFNPIKNLGPLGKQAAPHLAALTFEMNYLPTGESALLYFRPGSNRPAPDLNQLPPTFQASWLKPSGPIVTTEGPASPFFVKAPGTGAIEMKSASYASASDAGGKTILAIWAPAQSRLFPFTESIRLEALPGWNAYQLLEVEPSQLATMEAKLKQALQGKFEILSASLTGRSMIRMAFTIPGAFGVAEALSLSVFDIKGKETAHLAQGPMMPGIHNLEFPIGTGRSGLYFIRLTVRARRTDHVLAVRVFNPGGNTR